MKLLVLLLALGNCATLIGNKLIAQCDAKIVKLNVHAGQFVTPGSILMVVEAMKMQFDVNASDAMAGWQVQWVAAEGDVVEKDQPLLFF